MLERRRVVAPHGAHEAADQDDGVGDEREDRPRDRRRVAEPGDAARQPDRHAGIALAGHGRVDALAEPGVLHPEGEEREAEQDDRQHGRASLVVRRADHREEDLGRQDLVIAAEHERIAEIGHALDEAEQEGVGEAGPHERQRHGAEGRPALRAKRLRGFLQRRADALHDADQHQEGDRREGEELRDEDSRQAVDPARARHVEPFEEQGRKGARAPEQKDQREADHEGRRDDRQHRQDAQGALEAENPCGWRSARRRGRAPSCRCRRASPGTGCSRRRRSAGSR